MIERIRRLDLRAVWRHEARDFTTWLKENIDVLGDETGLQLSGVEREQPAGAFSVDLVAEDEDGRAVVIENQLERSDHDHLGKLLTYLVGVEAEKAIWIVADPRPEHVRTIAWLNESSSADFYLLKLEAIQIGDSEPAPLLTLIVGPSEETRNVGRTKQRMKEHDHLRYRFNERLLEHAKSKTQLHANVSPSKFKWMGAGAGITGFSFLYAVGEHNARVEFKVDTRDADKNNACFRHLLSKREQIQEAFGGPLDWDPNPGRQRCLIGKTYNAGGYRDEHNWDALCEQLSDGMARLEKALEPHMRSLRVVTGRGE